jgi:hypothetical protein
MASDDWEDYDKNKDPFTLFPHKDPERWKVIVEALTPPISSMKEFTVALRTINHQVPISFFKKYLKYAEAPGDGSCSDKQFLEKVRQFHCV